MPLQAFLIKKPFEISFTGNPMPYTFSLTPYSTIEKKQDIRLVIRILIENSFGSGSFTEIKSQAFYPNGKGEISFDVKNIIHAYLDYYLPNPGLLRPVQAINQRKRYRIDYLIQLGQDIVGDVEETDILTAIKGGMAYDQWHPKEFFTSLIVDKKAALQFDPLRAIGFDELRYFYWLYPYDDLAQQTVMIDILLNDQSTIQHELDQKLFVGKWGVCCVPVGFNQLKLNALVPAGLFAISYSIQIKTAVTSIVAPFILNLEQRNFYNTSQLIYRNSLGGMETLTLRGQVDFEADYARQQIQSTVPPSYFSNMIVQHQGNDVNSNETQKFKGDTGFLNKEATDRIRDFFLSAQKYEVKVGDDDNQTKLLPVTTLVKNTKFYSNRENLITTLIEWQRAYVNEFYTPNRAMPTVRACPAMESFAVTQINKNLLQIMFAMESPYDRVEIRVITSLGTQLFYFTGNARTIRQPFTNPVLNTNDTENIVIEARTVCDEYSDPMDLGPASTVNLLIVGNTLPIANDDTYNLAYGYNTPVVLPGSVLANDYDPDGDPIECVPDSGATNDGGAFDIDIAGIVTYTPPSSVYSGIDFFDYDMQEVGGAVTVTARVYINVGAVSGNIYAKIMLRNVETITGPNSSITTGEVWIDFYTNPATSQPIDITGMGLTINYNEHQFEQDYYGTQTNNDNPVAVTPGYGTQMKIFEGLLESLYSDPLYLYEQIYRLTHTMLPGTGYTPI